MTDKGRIRFVVITIAVAAMIGIVALVIALWPGDTAQDQMIAEYRAAKYQQYEQENAQYDDYEVEVAFLGDSLTDAYDLEKHYPQYVTANRGIAGDTSYDLEGRLQLSVYDLKPQVAVMLIGANNPTTVMNNYEAILKGFQENLPETKVVLLSMTSMGGSSWGRWNEKAQANNAEMKKLAEKYGYAFVDVYTPLLDPAIDQLREDYTTDGGHLTEEGYAVLTDTITPVLEGILGK